MIAARRAHAGLHEAAAVSADLPGSVSTQRPPADFKARPAHEVMGIVLRTQSEELQRIFLLCRDDPENADGYRLEAFESCPGLSKLWPQPFQAKFRAADGAVLIRFKTGPDGGMRVAANVVDL